MCMYGRYYTCKCARIRKFKPTNIYAREEHTATTKFNPVKISRYMVQCVHAVLARGGEIRMSKLAG